MVAGCRMLSTEVRCWLGLAIAFAVPVGVLAAVCSSVEYRNNRFVAPIWFVAELLGGVPSIVNRDFRLRAVRLPHVDGRGTRQALLHRLGRSSVVMMLPVVIRATEESLRLVPNSLREASYALGASRWQTVVKVLLPSCSPGDHYRGVPAVEAHCGETAPLLLTACGSNFMPRSPS